MIVEPKVKGFLCITAHPEGCAENVREQIAYVKSKGKIKDGCKSALIIGASTGYGLASRITAPQPLAYFSSALATPRASALQAQAGTTPPNLLNRQTPQAYIARISTPTLSATNAKNRQ